MLMVKWWKEIAGTNHLSTILKVTLQILHQWYSSYQEQIALHLTIKAYWWREHAETNPLSSFPDKETPKMLLLKMMARFQHLYPSEQAFSEILTRCLGLHHEIHSIRTHTQHLLIILTMRLQTKIYLVPPIPTVRKIRNHAPMLVLRALVLDPVTQAINQALPS